MKSSQRGNAGFFDAFFEKSGFVLLDGGMATELERRGAILDDPLWSAKILLERPDLIRQVHHDYFIAGADVATTASYQATFEGFAKRGLGKQEAARLMRSSVELACEARDVFWSKQENRAGRTKPLVAASVGPYGAYLADGSEYQGDYGLSVAELMDFHRERLEVLAETDADLLAFETVPCLAEAEALLKLLEQLPGRVAWLSFSCRDGGHTSHGEPVEEAALLTNASHQVVAVGVNCTAPIYVEEVLKRMAAVAQKPLLAYPNSGEGWDASARCWLPAGSAGDWRQLASRWMAAGARLLGGCCRTGPEDIRFLRQVCKCH